MHRWTTYEAAEADLASAAPAERLSQLLLEYGGGGLSLSMDELRRLFVYAWADGAEPG